MYNLHKKPIFQNNILYKIYFFYDLLNNMKLHSYEELKKANLNMNHINTLEEYIHHFIDTIKEYILRNFQNIKKIKIELEYFDKNNIIHSFIQNTYDLIHKNDESKNNIKCDYHKTIFLTIYDENHKPYFVGIFAYENIRQCDIDYLQYTKELRKANSL
jgi:hypothetical protein